MRVDMSVFVSAYMYISVVYIYIHAISGRVIPKTLKMVLDTFLPNTQQYKVRIKGKVDQYRERIRALSNTSVL